MGKPYYHNPYFLPLEFAKYALKWLVRDHKKDFVYNTEDDDQNPMLQFYCKEGNRKKYSVWELFAYDKKLSLKEIE